MKYVYQAFNRPLSTINNALGWYNTDESISTRLNNSAGTTAVVTKVDDLTVNNLENQTLKLADEGRLTLSKHTPPMKPAKIKKTCIISEKENKEAYLELAKLATTADLDMADPVVTSSYWYQELEKLSGECEELGINWVANPQIYKFICKIFADIGNIATLDLSFNVMSNEHANLFAILNQTPGLKGINFAHTNITQQDTFVQIANMFAKSSLIELDLSYNIAPINDEATCKRFVNIVSLILDEITSNSSQNKTIHIRNNGNHSSKSDAYKALTQKVEKHNTQSHEISELLTQDFLPDVDVVSVIGEYCALTDITLDLGII